MHFKNNNKIKTFCFLHKIQIFQIKIEYITNIVYFEKVPLHHSFYDILQKFEYLAIKFFFLFFFFYIPLNVLFLFSILFAEQKKISLAYVHVVRCVCMYVHSFCVSTHRVQSSKSSCFLGGFREYEKI